MHDKKIKENLDFVLRVKSDLLKKKTMIEESLVNIEKDIHELERELLSESIKQANLERYSMTTAQALLDFGDRISLFSPSNSVQEIQDILLDYLHTQSLLDFLMLYNEDGVALVNDLLKGISEISEFRKAV